MMTSWIKCASCEDHACDYVVCRIRGFDGERRPLSDIPEVRAFCRRIVNLGFISYLHPALKLDTEFPEIDFMAWGAAEVWLCSEGLNYESDLTEDLLSEIEFALLGANEKADQVLGPMK
jgi:hypothetical protein